MATLVLQAAGAAIGGNLIETLKEEEGLLPSRAEYERLQADAAALTRIRTGDFQAATVPSPLWSEGWQIVDELNRAFAGEKASGYVPQIHVSTKENASADNFWDPTGYQEAYKKIWGK